MESGRRAPSGRWGAFFAALLVVGWIQQRLGTPFSGRAFRLLYDFQRAAFFQVGAAGLACWVLLFLLGRFRPVLGERIARRTRYLAPRVLFAFVFAFILAEATVRIWFWDGQSFSSHGGPIVRRFERDFRFNRFDGPSRGPQTSGPKAPGVIRVLVQGDSIAWGQGVRGECDLFPARLLTLLTERRPGTEMAVLAAPGREIDGHLKQIRKFGPEIAPDVVVYQWFANDCELRTKHLRPNRQYRPLRRRLFFHRLLADSSYFWFLLDYQLQQLRPAPNPSYEDYLLDRFGSDTPDWEHFAGVFAEWAEEARKLTPRVLVLLYPLSESKGLEPFYGRIRALCRAEGVETVDLKDAFAGLRVGPGGLYASRYDRHPGTEAHLRMARALFDRILQQWPELVPR